MRMLVSEQMKIKRYFEIVSPFKNSCAACNGSGETYKFKQKTVLVNCHICAGKRKVTVKVKVKCSACKGNGIYKKRWKGGVKFVTCKYCHGTKIKEKEIFIKCEECQGKGKKRKVVLDHTLESTTPCKYCKQLGFAEDKPKKKPQKSKTLIYRRPDNPVLTINLADKIKTSIIDQP